MKNVENKVIIITGASSGIGEETARVLAREGAKVVLSARREERLKKLADEIGENAAYLKSDVVNADEMKALVALAKEKSGRSMPSLPMRQSCLPEICQNSKLQT